MRVIKVGGRAQEDPRLAPALAVAFARAPGALCLVHGGGAALTALQRALGAEPRFVGGRRITSATDVHLARMALSGGANKELVARLITAGARAVGLSGEDGPVIGAEPLATVLDRAGAPSRIDPAPIRLLAGAGYLPVISPLARDLLDPAGRPLNVNADDAAAAIAVALGAVELLFVSDVPGVLVEGLAVDRLDIEGARRAVAAGTARGGMAAKLEAAAAALDGGIPRVRIGDIAAIGDDRLGTVVAADAEAA